MGATLYYSVMRSLATSVVLVLVLLGVALGCAGRSQSDFMLGGIQVNEPDMDRWHRQLERSGFNTLAMTVYARQQAWNSSDLSFEDPFSPVGSPADLVAEIRSAKRRGLSVVMVLRVALDSAVDANKFLWHGLIMPSSDSDLETWFYRYGQFVRSWASIAEREGVDVIGIGSELSTLTSTVPVNRLPELAEYYLNQSKQLEQRRRILAAGDVDERHLVGGWNQTYDDLERYVDDRELRQRAWAEEVTGVASFRSERDVRVDAGTIERINHRRRLLDRHWRSLVASVREIYRGRVTYAANFDQYGAVGFWDALDLIGVNAYFPLRSQLDADETELEATLQQSWRGVLDELVRWRASRELSNTPFLFTELGYTGRRGSTIQPWAGAGFAVLDGGGASSDMVVWDEQQGAPLERAWAVRGLRLALARQQPGVLAGLLYWKLSTVAGHRQVEPFVLVLGERPPDPLLPELQQLARAASGLRQAEP